MQRVQILNGLVKKFFWLERNRKYCLQTHYSKNTIKKIRFFLFVTDIIIWIFYISKGFIGAKIKAELDIRRNKNLIQKKYEELEKNKIILDNEIVDLFSDKIFVPQAVASSRINNLFNNLISYLSEKARKRIKS